MIFYYYADHYINFKDLITELYRIYKTRIWLSAVNPASFSQHALGQPPSAIGPGAITQNQNLNNSYTMAYGPDPDPYGAVRPYNIGYETYTPNYPGIPGMANSFSGQNEGAYAANANGAVPVPPSVQPGVQSTGTINDYQFYYDRNSAVHAPEPPSLPFTPADTPVPTTSNHPAAAPPFNPWSSQWYGGAFANDGLQNGPMNPWNAVGTPINPASAGLGRPAEIQQPIGTRPAMGGMAQTANGQQNGKGVPGLGHLGSRMHGLQLHERLSHADEMSRER